MENLTPISLPESFEGSDLFKEIYFAMLQKNPEERTSLKEFTTKIYDNPIIDQDQAEKVQSFVSISYDDLPSDFHNMNINYGKKQTGTSDLIRKAYKFLGSFEISKDFTSVEEIKQLKDCLVKEITHLEYRKCNFYGMSLIDNKPDGFGLLILQSGYES